MNFIADETDQKLRGGYYTPTPIAKLLVDWVSEINPKSILEPSCGDGAFLSSIKKAGLSSVKDIHGFELDPEEASKAKSIPLKGLKIKQADFLNWYVTNEHKLPVFDAVVGNPPFIRYQYLPEAQKLLAERIFKSLQLPFTKHTNAWVPFVLASIKMLNPGGRLAMVIPSEILHLPHARSLRKYLLSQCSKILIIDPQELWFEGTLQGTVLLLAEKIKSSNFKKHGAAVSSIRSLGDVSKGLGSRFKKAIFSNHSGLESKWMSLLLTKSERELLNKVTKHPQVARFEDLASVDVGIVTGANKFFLVSDSVVDEFGLHEWVHPMFGRSDHLKGLVHTTENQIYNQSSGLPSNFLYFDVDDYEALPKNVQLYIDSGVDQNLQKRFKCRNRSPWFRVPSVYKSPLAMLKRAHHYPRLVLNQAESYSTDTAYRVNPTTTTAAETLVGSFVNSLTCLSAELEGRSYGGGVLELVPSEIERLLLPHVGLKKTLKKRNKDFIGKESAESFLLKQDTEILIQGLGLSETDAQILHSAWGRLRNRRQRKS